MDRNSTSTEAPTWLEPLTHRPLSTAARFARDLRTAAEILHESNEPRVEPKQSSEAA